MLEAMRRYANRTSGGVKAEGDQRARDASAVSFTGRVAGWSARHRWKVVLGAIALLVISFLLSSAIGVQTSDVFGTGESRKGHQLVEDRFEQLPSFDSVIIKNPGLDIDDPAFRSTVDPLVEELRGLEGIEDVESYYDSGAPPPGFRRQECCHCPRRA